MQSNADPRRFVCGYACLRLGISTEQETFANGYNCWCYIEESLLVLCAYGSSHG